MAQIKKRIGKTGKISYLIRVSSGYDIYGRQIKRSMTWTPPPGMTEKKADKQARLEALHFEERITAGALQDGNMRFVDFTRKWYAEYVQAELKPTTQEQYRNDLQRINKALGHLKIREIKGGHLAEFYNQLRTGEKLKPVSYRAKINLADLLQKQKMTRQALSRQAGVSITAVNKACLGRYISPASMEKITAALNLPPEKVFERKPGDYKLSPSAVRRFHAVLSSIFRKAVQWGFIPFSQNPAQSIEAPKARPKEAAYMEEAEARRLLECLQGEHIRYRAIITLGLLSGMRKGELLGLRWQDVDFRSETITIRQITAYTKDTGLITTTPKTRSSGRPLKLARSAFLLLREYKAWQDQQREALGDYWKASDDRIFTNEDGSPMRPGNISRWFRKFTRANGFEGVHLHTLRHTYASLMIADGTPLVVVSRRLGHAQVSTTADIYAHMISSADEKAARIAERFSDLVTPDPEADTLQQLEEQQEKKA